MQEEIMKRLWSDTRAVVENPQYSPNGLRDSEYYPDLIVAYQALMEGDFADRMIRFVQQDERWTEFVTEMVGKGEGVLWSQLSMLGRANRWYRHPMRSRLVTLLKSVERPEVGIACLCALAEVHPIVVAFRSPDGTALDPGIDVAVINDERPELAMADIAENDLLHMFVMHFGLQQCPRAALDVTKIWPQYAADRSDIELLFSEEEERVSATSSEAAQVVAELKKELKHCRKAEQALKDKLNHANRTRSDKDRKIQQQLEAAKVSELARVQLEKEVILLKEDLAEKDREIRRQKDLVQQERKGRLNATIKRKESTQSYEEVDAELRDLNDFATQLEARLYQAESLLEQERARRKDIETTLDAFGFNSLMSSVNEMSSAINLFGKIRDALEQVANEREAERREALSIQANKDLEEYERVRNNQVPLEINRALQQHYLQQLDEFEGRIINEINPQRIIIDGHNVLNRTSHPESEQNKRKWMITLLEEFTSRLDAKGCQPQIDVVFDTFHDTNTIACEPLLYVTYAKKTNGNNDGTTGADAFIVAELNASNQDNQISLITSDKKHIWSQARDLEESGGPSIDYIEAQTLANYLGTLQKYFDAYEQDM